MIEMAEAKVKKNSQFKEIARRFFKNKLATLGFIMFIIVLFFAIFGLLMRFLLYVSEKYRRIKFPG